MPRIQTIRYRHRRSGCILYLGFESETGYAHLDVDTSAQQIADAVDGSLTANDLTSFLVDQCGHRRQVDYSGVLTDGLTHYVQVGRCLDWTLGEDLRDQIGNVP